MSASDTAERAGPEIYQGPLTPAEEEVYEKNLAALIERNEKVFG